jgi:hypothetical protein
MVILDLSGIFENRRRRNMRQEQPLDSADAGTPDECEHAHTQTWAAHDVEVDEPFLAMLTAMNDDRVGELLAANALPNVLLAPRRSARLVRRLASAYCWQAPILIAPIHDLVTALEAVQHDDGTYDIGNLHSPPDTAFVVQDLCMSWTLLHAQSQSILRPSLDALERMSRKAGRALATGGVHTPNHRWEVCAALARINHLWPERRYVRRIHDWLGEGIDIDADGQYSERSSTYAAAVTNPCLLTLAWLFGRQMESLRQHVRRNLEATLYLLEPNGDVETVHSRRQDQTQVRDIWWYLLQYRELALLEVNGQFARVARMIEQRGIGELGDFLADVMERPELGAVLPAEAPLPDDYAKVFEVSRLARIRHVSTTATIFGGTDFHATRTIASGLSTNPTFFKLRKGAAILESVRLAPTFFSTGHFRSKGLVVQHASYRLSDEVSVPYYLPLPRRYRRDDGDYTLTDDGRFFSQMSFPHRRQQSQVLRTEIQVTELDGGFALDFALTESAAPFTIELCFRRGGILSGVQPLEGADTYQLVEGFGAYTVDDWRIEFGPGNGAGPLQPVHMDPGDRYTYRNGTLVPEGIRVYVTGRSPVQYRLVLR